MGAGAHCTNPGPGTRDRMVGTSSAPGEKRLERFGQVRLAQLQLAGSQAGRDVVAAPEQADESLGRQLDGETGRGGAALAALHAIRTQLEVSGGLRAAEQELDRF